MLLLLGYNIIQQEGLMHIVHLKQLLYNFRIKWQKIMLVMDCA